MRSRSRRVQGDDQAIRGLLQMLGELFRGQKLADMPVGHLVTLDHPVQHALAGLNADLAASFADGTPPDPGAEARMLWDRAMAFRDARLVSMK